MIDIPCDAGDRFRIVRFYPTSLVSVKEGVDLGIDPGDIIRRAIPGLIVKELIDCDR